MGAVQLPLMLPVVWRYLRDLVNDLAFSPRHSRDSAGDEQARDDDLLDAWLDDDGTDATGL